jgi:hypothetical protein
MTPLGTGQPGHDEEQIILLTASSLLKFMGTHFLWPLAATRKSKL